MNIGIYISDLSNTEQLKEINKLIDDVVHKKDVYDISLFYDNISFNPHNISCGMFNSTEIWSFNGSLIVTSLYALNTALNIVNNIDLFYYYGWEKEKNIINLAMSTRNNVKIICRSEKDSKEIYRLTGKKPIGISENFNNMVELLLEHRDEYKSNNNDVYQTA
jgi:hypothetical protein